MKKDTNLIGLDSEETRDLSAELNELLSHYQVLYMNARGYHWNVKGPQFFELHLKFEEIYNDLLLKIDELAERILTLGHTPNHTFSSYLAHSSIHEEENVTDGNACVTGLVKGFGELLVKQRTILEKASNVRDEGTTALMSDYIRQQEKLIWMLSAYLG
jgi:starvation-inducible DNA-binding protein